MCCQHLDHDSFMQIVVLIPSKLRLEARFKIRPNDVRFTALIIMIHTTVAHVYKGQACDWLPDAAWAIELSPRPRRSLQRSIRARFLIPLEWCYFRRYHPAHIFCPGILIFGIVVPWDKRRKNSKAFFQKIEN